MRPAGPEPCTNLRSTPASRALRRTAGAASGFSPGGRGAPVFGSGWRPAAFWSSDGRGGGLAADASGAGSGLALGGGGGSWAGGRDFGAAGRSESGMPGASMRISSAPTASTSPTAPPSASTLPATGVGISTVALSVMTPATTWSSLTRSPTLTAHSTISASATPSPTSGILIERTPISGLHRLDERAADARGTGEIVPFLRVGIGRIPARDALDRRLERIEARLRHLRGELGAETRGQRRLMHDHAAAGLVDRGLDGVDVERQQRAQIDDLRIDSSLLGCRLRNMDHRAIAEHGDPLPFASHGGLTERHDVATLRNFT